MDFGEVFRVSSFVPVGSVVSPGQGLIVTKLALRGVIAQSWLWSKKYTPGWAAGKWHTFGGPDNTHLSSSLGTGCMGFAVCSEMVNFLSHRKAMCPRCVSQTESLPLWSIEWRGCLACIFTVWFGVCGLLCGDYLGMVEGLGQILQSLRVKWWECQQVSMEVALV